MNELSALSSVVFPDPVPPEMSTLSRASTQPASSVSIWAAERGAKKGASGQTIGGLSAALLLGALFIALQLVEWHGKPFGLTTDPYGSLFFTITGFHMLHVAGGLVMLAVLLAWAAMGYFSPRRHAPLSIGALYWHFVGVVWLAVYSALYLSTRLA